MDNRSAQPIERSWCTENDTGSALVLVLIIAVLLIAALGIAVTTSIAGLRESSTYKSSSQGELASQSGLASELAAMRNTASYTNFPCNLTGSLGVAGAQSNYAVAVAYSAAGTALSCSGPTLGGSTIPDHATLTSVGKAAHGTQTIMKEDVAIQATAGTAQSPAVGYAIFTENSLNLTNAAVVNQSGSNIPDIYAGGVLTCDNGTKSQGSVTSLDPIVLANACWFSGDVGSLRTVTLENSAKVGGSVTSCAGSATTGITMTGNSLVQGDATAISGAVALANSGTIDGDATASESITKSGGAKIDGTSQPNVPGLTCPSSITTPIPFPVYDPGVSDWLSAGWNVVQIPNSSYPSCGDYFTSYSSGAEDSFMTAISTVTQKTVVYAPTCDVSYQNFHTFDFNADIALVVQTFTLQNENQFESTTSVHHDFSVLASPGASCSTSTVDINLSNQSDFALPAPPAAPSMSVFFYTPGQVDYANVPSMLGQILACGGMTGENAFKLAFDPSAAEEIPGVTATPATVTFEPEDKYVTVG